MTTRNPTSRTTPTAKQKSAKKARVKRRKRTAGTVNDLFLLPIVTLSLKQLVAAGVLNEKSKLEGDAYCSLRVELRPDDIAAIGTAVAAAISATDED